MTGNDLGSEMEQYHAMERNMMLGFICGEEKKLFAIQVLVFGFPRFRVAHTMYIL